MTDIFTPDGSTQDTGSFNVSKTYFTKSNPNIRFYYKTGIYNSAYDEIKFFTNDIDALTIDANQKVICNGSLITNLDWNKIDGKPANFPTNWDNVASKPSIFPTNWDNVSGKPSTFVSHWDYISFKPSIFPTNWDNVSGKPSIFPTDWDNVALKPTFATVATSGLYNDLSGKPDILTRVASLQLFITRNEVLYSPDLIQYSNLGGKPTLFDGTWNSLSGKPTYFQTDWNTTITNRPDLTLKQDVISVSNPITKTGNTIGLSYDSTLTLNGAQLSVASSINSKWTKTGNNIYNNNTGNVGIGTNNPTSILELNASTPTLKIVDVSANRLPRLEFLRGTNTFGSDIYTDWRIENNTGNLNFIRQDTTYSGTSLTLDYLGNVGIGITNPNHLIEVINNNYTGPLLTIDTGITNATTQMPRAIGQTMIKIGKNSYSTTAGDYYGIGFGYAPALTDKTCCEIGCIITDKTGSEIGDILFSTRPNNTNIASTERMRILSNGNVGIGLTNPTYKLDVSGTFNVSGNFTGTGNNNQITNTTNGAVYFNIRNNSAGSSAYTQMGVQNSTGIWAGIFLNSSTRTADGGVNTLTLRNDAGDLRLSATSDSPYIYLKNSTGCVGVKNNNPAYTLDVTGDVNVSGNFKVNGVNFTGSSSQWTTTGTNIYYSSGNVGIGTATTLQKLHIEDGSVFIGDSSYVSTSLGTANGYKLIFDNTYNSAVGSGNICNKILLHNTTGFGGGFGVETGAVVYQSGDTHRFYTGTTSSAYGTERFKVYGSGVNVVGDYYDDGRLIQDHLFNNLGRTHGTFTNFNNLTDFGCHFIMGTENGPNTNSSQYYEMTMGLGSEYLNYKLQLAFNRVNEPYMSMRRMENGGWGGWQKVYAGYADTSGGLTGSPNITVGTIKTTGNVGIGDANPLCKLTVKSTYDNANSGLCINANDDGVAEKFLLKLYPYVVAGGRVGYRFRIHNSPVTSTIKDVLTFDHIGNAGFNNPNPIESGNDTNLCIGTCASQSVGGLVISQNNANGGVRKFSIGYNTDFEVVIGDYGNINADQAWINTFRMAYNAPASSIVIAGNGYITMAYGYGTSDQRIKTDIKTIENSLFKVLNLRGIEYSDIREGCRHIGLIAQEVEGVIPEVVYTNNEGIKAISYANMAGLFVNAFKEMNEIILNLNKRIEELEKLNGLK